MLGLTLRASAILRSLALMRAREAKVLPASRTLLNVAWTKPDRPVHTVFLHCSASDRPAHDDVEVLRRWHLARGWRDIGYHFVITQDGKVHEGRPVEEVPAAQKGHNEGTIAVCLTGLERFTAAQFGSLRVLCQCLDGAYEEHDLRFRGHCEVSRKRCPVFDYRAVLGLDERGYMREVPDA